MANTEINNIKLGILVISGLAVLVFSLFLIGKNQNLFGGSFELKARFTNINGLMEGNNVWYSGIQAGTIKNIQLLNDTVIEVTIRIDKDIKSHIRSNAVASIGTEGLMGNKIINITPAKSNGKIASAGDILPVQKPVNTDDLLQTLSKTNNDIAVISGTLRETVLRISRSPALDLLDDKTIGRSLRSSLDNVNSASANARLMTRTLNELMTQAKKGKGVAGAFLSDTGMAANMKTAITNFKLASQNANRLTVHLDSLALQINYDLHKDQGIYHLLLKDTSMNRNFSLSLDNIRKGTDGFNQNMEALKHSFLFRGYFKKQAKEASKNTIKSGN